MAYQRNGNNRGGNKGGNGPEYVYSSSLTFNLCDDNKSKEPVKMIDLLGILSDEIKMNGTSGELNFTLTAEKADQFIALLQAAQEDPNGDGGLRLSLYIKEGENPKTGEVFDSMSILIMGKFPPKNNGGNRRGGSFRGNSGGGRKSYGDEPQEAAQNTRGGRGTPRGGDDQGNEDVKEDTRQSGRAGRGNRTQDTPRGGRGQNARGNVSPSNKQDFTADDIPY